MTADTTCPLCERVDHHLHDADEWTASTEWGLEWRRVSTMLGTPPWLHRPGDGCPRQATAADYLDALGDPKGWE